MIMNELHQAFGAHGLAPSFQYTQKKVGDSVTFECQMTVHELSVPGASPLLSMPMDLLS